MSDLGLPIIDETVNQTNRWLNRLGERLGRGDQHAYQALRAGLHTLRDRLPVDEAAALGAQLPHLVRGIYYENWRPADAPTALRTTEQYAEELGRRLVDDTDPDPETTARAVFWVLKSECEGGMMEKIRSALPEDVARNLYDAA
jgi:uncharacterized protein (DUF2267 family)